MTAISCQLTGFDVPTPVHPDWYNWTIFYTSHWANFGDVCELKTRTYRVRSNHRCTSVSRICTIEIIVLQADMVIYLARWGSSGKKTKEFLTLEFAHDFAMNLCCDWCELPF